MYEVLIGSVISAFVIPASLKVVEVLLEKRKEKQAEKAKRKHALTSSNIELGDDLRDELRDENITLKKSVVDLQQQLAEANRLVQELEQWKRKFYRLKKENTRLEFDLSLMTKEIELLREKYAEYIAIRERAAGQFGDEDGPL